MNNIEKIVKDNLNLIHRTLSCEGEWTINKITDVYGNSFDIPMDTKVVSKLFESQLEPIWTTIAEENDYTIEFSSKQNQYPDVTLTCNKTGDRYAIDEKSSYKRNDKVINGMTLGTYKGYFRDRGSSKNTLYPYNSYKKHFILGILYDRVDERITNIDIFFNEKWRVASRKPGSGNTTNIGSIKKIKDLIESKNSIFTSKEEFDNYWINY